MPPCLALALVALGASAAPVKVAWSGFDAVGVPAATVEAASVSLGDALTGSGLRVITPVEAAVVIPPAARRTLGDCVDRTEACVAPWAAAAGAEAVLTGTLRTSGEGLQVDLRLADIKDRAPWATVSQSLEVPVSASRWEALAKGLAESARQKLGRELPGKQQFIISDEPPPQAAPAPGVAAATVAPPVLAIEAKRSLKKRFAAVPIVSGLALCGLGGGFLSVAKNKADSLSGGGARDPYGNLSLGAAMSAARSGNRDQVVGLVAMGVGGAAFIFGIGMLAVEDKDAKDKKAGRLALFPTGNGVALSGEWP